MTTPIERFSSHKFGVFNHYLVQMQNNPKSVLNAGMGELSWNEHVNRFDTEKLAYTLSKTGAGYYVITLMQCNSHLCAPNETFDKIAGTKPGEACSIRDLPLDLYKSLSKYGIDLFLYYTGDGPLTDKSGEKFGLTTNSYGGPSNTVVTESFVQKWASVLEEYAVRYSDKVKGWWIDGCYRVHNGYNYTDDLLALYYNAIKKGNPDAIVAMNNGVKKEHEKNYINEDFVAGEFTKFETLPKAKYVDGALSHTLAPLGTYLSIEDVGWGKPGLKHTKEHMLDYVKKASEIGAVTTIDAAVYADGSLDDEQVEVLKYIGKGLGKI